MAKSLASFTGVVKFTAKWCGPCQRVHPHLKHKAIECEVDVFEVDIDDEENGALVQQYAVTSIPAMVFLVDGKTVATVVGGDMSRVNEGFGRLLDANAEKNANQNKLPISKDATIDVRHRVEAPKSKQP